VEVPFLYLLWYGSPSPACVLDFPLGNSPNNLGHFLFLPVISSLVRLSLRPFFSLTIPSALRSHHEGDSLGALVHKSET